MYKEKVMDITTTNKNPTKPTKQTTNATTTKHRKRWKVFHMWP